MKMFIVLVLALNIILKAEESTAVQVSRELCHIGKDECWKGECCVEFVPSATYPNVKRSGVCANYTQGGEACVLGINDHEPNHFLKCGCIEGFECAESDRITPRYPSYGICTEMKEAVPDTTLGVTIPDIPLSDTPLGVTIPDTSLGETIPDTPLGGTIPDTPLGGTIPDNPLGGTFPDNPLGGTIPDTPLGGTIPDTPLGGIISGSSDCNFLLRNVLGGVDRNNLVGDAVKTVFCIVSKVLALLAQISP